MLPALLSRKASPLHSLESEDEKLTVPCGASAASPSSCLQDFGVDFLALLQPRKYTWSDKDQTVLVD